MAAKSTEIDDMETFDEFMDRKGKVYFLRPVADILSEDGHLYYACTCPEYLHYALCKHVIAASLHGNGERTRALFKPEWTVTLLRVRSRPGRPRKVSAALVIDK